MIVKNEAATLERCLQSARPHVDEIVVVDTGSTDETVEIAGRYADVLDEIEWPDSFSAARNHSLDLASGQFVMILDGDEYLEDAAGWERLLATLRRQRVIGIQVPVLNLLDSDGVIEADRIWQERVFLNHPHIRYDGKVHNQIQTSIMQHVQRTKGTMVRVAAEVVHTGYALTKDRMKEKYRPRLSLLKAEYENPRDARHRAYYAYQLGLVYFILQEYRSALDLFNGIDYTKLSDQNGFYTHMLAAQTALRLSDSDAALVHADGMLTRSRTEPVAYLLTGYALLSARKLVDGLLMLVEAYNINVEQGKEARFVLNDRRCLSTLANTCEKLGLQQNAEGFRAQGQAEEVDVTVVQEMIQTMKIALVRLDMNQAA